jgi:hypothetical protein
VTSADVPEVSWEYEAKITGIKFAWWMLLGLSAWVAVWKIASLIF